MTLSENVEMKILAWFDKQTERVADAMKRVYPARVIRTLVEEAIDTCTRWEYARLLGKHFEHRDHELLIRTSERRWVAKMIDSGAYCRAEAHDCGACNCEDLAKSIREDTRTTLRIEDDCCDECKTGGVCKPGDRHCCHYMP